MKHTVKNGFHTHPVRINLLGVGGGGSLVLSGLVRLHLAMKSLGHPYGLDVEVWDPDRVSPTNIGRQLFAASEVGLNKAEALVNRYNLGFALNWKAHPERYHSNRGFDVLIACVDSRRSRKEIFQTLPKAASSPHAGRSSSATVPKSCRIPIRSCRLSSIPESRRKISRAAPWRNRFPFRNSS